MKKSGKRPKSMSDALRELLEREDVGELEGGDARQQLLLALIRKAMSGDLKTFEFLLRLIGESPPIRDQDPDTQENALRVELGPGVEELAQ